VPAGGGIRVGAVELLDVAARRLGERAGLSEALLGMVAALAADAPEITSAVTALAHGQASVGAGVVIGSNAFNLVAPLVPGWSAARLWRVSVLLCLAVGALDAATGRHLILIGLLAAGPVTAVPTGRWRRTALTGAQALGLGALLGVPDGVFATAVQYAFLAAIVVVTAFATAGAALIGHHADPCP